MNVRPAEGLRIPPNWTGALPTDEALHAGALHGATVTGEAARRELSIRIGLWLDEAGSVRQARWRGAEDAELRAVAEAACTMLETGTDPSHLSSDGLRGALQTRAGAHADRADLVVAAVHAALQLRGTSPGA